MRSYKHGAHSSQRNASLRFEQFEERIALTTTIHLDFGEAMGINEVASTTVDDLSRFGIPAQDPTGLGLHGLGLGPDLTQIGRLPTDIFTFGPSQLDLNGNAVPESADLGILAANVVPIIERTLEPFDVEVEVVSKVKRTASGDLDFTDAHALLDFSAQNASGDAYVLIGEENQIGISFGAAARDDLASQDFPNPNKQDELAIVNASNVAAFVQDGLTMGYSDSDIRFEERLYHLLANTITHEAFHTFSFHHTVDNNSPFFNRTETILDVVSGQLLPFYETHPNLDVPLNPHPAPSIITRWDLVHGESFSNPLVVQEPNNYLLAMDVFGFRDSDLSGRPDQSHVTGTGLHDEILLSANGDLVTVEVRAYDDPARTSLSGTETYQIDLTGTGLTANDRTDGLIVVEPSRGNDKIVLSGDFTMGNPSTQIEIRAGGDDDELEIGATAKVASITFEGERGGDSLVSLSAE